MSGTPGSTRPLVDVRLEALSTRGGRPPGVHEVGVHVRYGEFFTFLGPPKSGKSDVLRAIAGFLPMTSGRVLVDGQDISLLPPRARGLGYVFQEGALWSHLTVAQHIAFGLEQQGLAGAEVARKVETVAGRLGLAGLEARRPPELSIEQRRRLAIARALAVEPRVLLLDEPLANVDPAARKTLRLDLAKLHRALAVTTIHSTRNAADALALSARLAVMGAGRALQVGNPDELYHRPSSRAVAETLGPANFLRVSVVEVRDLGVVVETDGGHQVPVAGTGAFRKGDRGLLVLRPETLSLTEAAMARGPGIPGKVALRVFEGARHLDELEIVGDLLVELGLHVVDQDGEVWRKLVELATDQGGREVLGDLRERAQPVREGALEDHGAETVEPAGRTPERVGRARVPRVDEARRAVVDDEPRRRHGVVHVDRRHPQVRDALLDVLDERPVLDDGDVGVRDLREVGPEDVVEDAPPERAHHGIDAGDRHGGAGLTEAERLAEVHEAGDMVQVRVRDQRVLDRELLGNRQRARHGARVDQRPVVDEKRGGAVPEPLAAEGAEHAEFHPVAILAQKNSKIGAWATSASTIRRWRAR